MFEGLGELWIGDGDLVMPTLARPAVALGLGAIIKAFKAKRWNSLTAGLGFRIGT